MDAPAYKEFYYLINGRYPFVDIVTETEAWAYGLNNDCYHLTVSDEYPYHEDRGDWEPVSITEFPVWVQNRCAEVTPVLKIMEPT